MEQDALKEIQKIRDKIEETLKIIQD